jgi:hypothetical protein
MNWPFKIFDSLTFTGKAGNKEINQKAKKVRGKVQQAGRDIHNYPKVTKKPAPLLFINGLGWTSTQDGVSLRPEFLNGSEQVLFIEGLDIMDDYQKFEVSVKAQESLNTNLPSRPLPLTDEIKEITLYYHDATNIRYMSNHYLSLEPRADGKFNFGTDIKFQGPVKRVRK